MMEAGRSARGWPGAALLVALVGLAMACMGVLLAVDPAGAQALAAPLTSPTQQVLSTYVTSSNVARPGPELLSRMVHSPSVRPVTASDIEGLTGGSAKAAESELGGSGIIYRTGSRTDGALTDASGVSFRDSVSSSTSAEHPQIFKPGDKIWGVDRSKLPPGAVVRDGVPAGHVSVFATPEEITGAVIDDPFLSGFGLKALDEFGAYRIPK